MPDKDPKPGKRRPATSSPSPEESSLESIGEFVVEHKPVPPKGPIDKRIHPRRRLPPVPSAPAEITENGRNDN